MTTTALDLNSTWPRAETVLLIIRVKMDEVDYNSDAIINA